MQRLMRRVEHGTYRDRCLWRNAHHSAWLTRLCERMRVVSDGRQSRYWQKQQAKPKKAGK